MRLERLPAPVPFSGSYDPMDVTFLLKPVAMPPIDIRAKERLILSGARHYSEMIAPETPPDARYLALYAAAERRNRARLAQDVVDLAAHLYDRARGRDIVLASLARAGTPIGVLLRRVLARRGARVAHYSLSIIRDRGIDREALRFMAARHDPADIVFVDGWTGKGVIAAELRASLRDPHLGINPTLAVVADPAGVADIAASSDDYLIASGLLNAVVSGLVSRSVLSPETVGPGEFHACAFYPQWTERDLSRRFVDQVSAAAESMIARPLAPRDRLAAKRACAAMLDEIARRAGTTDRNHIKPGIAEATRAFLRRVPERLYLRDATDPDTAHLIHLAHLPDVPIEPLASGHYRAVTVIGRAA